MPSAVLLTIAVALPAGGLEEWYARCAEGDWAAASAQAGAVLAVDSARVDALAALMISDSHGCTGSLEPLPAKAAVAMDPGSALAWTASGTVLLGRGDSLLDSAEEALLESARLDDADPLCWYALGLLMERRGDGARAMEYHRAALDIDPRFLPSALQTARLLRGSGSPDGALAVLVGIRGTGSPAARLALGESVILLDSLGREPEADSLAIVLDGSGPGVWLELADQYLDDHPSRVRESLTRASESPGLETMRAGIARILADLGDFEGACTEARAALEAGGDTTLALSVLGRSLLELGRNSEAEETFLRLVELGSGTVDALNALGWLSELRARTTDAVEYYLDALVLDPSDPFARERLLVMADDSYDPFAWSSSSGGFSANCSADLSVEHGNRERVNIGGSATLAWLIDGRGTSVDLGVGGRSVTWESDEGFGVEERQTDTGWASLSADCWLGEHLYLEAGTDWDRQRFTVRPWQVSSYLACGLRERIVPWFSLTPELGLGYVRTKWETRILEQITGQTTIYASTGLWFEKPHTFVQHAEISGELYVPPDSPDDFISSGRISLAFRTWEPLSLSLGYEVDYTRIPEIATWKKYDTRFSVNLTFTLI